MTSTLASPAAPKSPKKIDFSAHVRPIISAKCYHCHGPDDESRKAKLRLDVREEAVRERDGHHVIKPGDLKASELVRRITSADPDEVMPPPKAGHPLTPEEIDVLKKWIQQGAPYAGHWAFKKPERPPLPDVKQKPRARNAIDFFILDKLEEQRLRPSPPADRYSLLRRVSLDLTGLPPTPEEVDAFAQDKSPGAFEAVVDRLLASPAYGEKWARMWLDLARYADSAGYGSDPLRLNIWPYRDWLIQALNHNLPFDQFTLEQLAGDLLENPTQDQLVATAFHRNTMTNTEGGTDDEEWRVAAVKDRANVTMQVWMGLTLSCAQCHTHKFDPITQREYYQFYAFFNQTEDNDQPDERPTLPLPNAAEQERMDRLKAQIAALEKELESDRAELRTELRNWLQARKPDDWAPLEAIRLNAAHGTTLSQASDRIITAGGESPDKDTYTLHFKSPSQSGSGLRLEVFPADDAGKQGPGRSAQGHFVLNEFTLSVKPEPGFEPRARFVRIELPGKDRVLSLAEVQVLSDGANIATQGKARQSSVDYEGEAARAIDGNTDGHFDNQSTTHTKTERQPWWEVDLGEERPLEAIVIWNRTDGSVGNRLANARVMALSGDREPVWAARVDAAPKPSVRLAPAEEHTIVLHRATASHSQKDYDVSEAIDADGKRKSGWSVGGEPGTTQLAIFESLAPIPPGSWKVRLVQNSGKQSTLARFRLSATDHPAPVVFVPAEISALLERLSTTTEGRKEAEALRWFRQYAAATAALQQKLEVTKADLDSIKPLTVPIMRELPLDRQRVTRFLNKGNFLDPGDPLTPGVPTAFHPWPEGAPVNRIGVARWLMHPDNPLTARVMVNRIWAQLFGTGLVETEEDFGTQGTLPTHPELLDWLAVEFRDGGWNVKQLIKTIAMSATYQQSSRITPELLEKDPRNRWLARAPRQRLDAESVRDQALALSGLLSGKIGGPSVYPPQPEGLWRAAFNGQRSYPTSQGDDRYRRGIYTIWRRTIPYPSMATFDAPSRETCTFRRLPTNTPLQAYVTLNDPVYVEAAQALGRRLVREGGNAVEERVRFGLRLVLGRPPHPAHVAELVKLYHSELEHYRSKESDALKLATQPLGPLPEGWSPAEGAAWTVIGNVLLNLDGVLVKS